MAELIKCDICGKVMHKVPWDSKNPPYHRIDFDGGRYTLRAIMKDSNESDEDLSSEDFGITVDSCDKCYKKIKSYIDTLKKGGNEGEKRN